jgi:hypothetical protein
MRRASNMAISPIMLSGRMAAILKVSPDSEYSRASLVLERTESNASGAVRGILLGEWWKVS